MNKFLVFVSLILAACSVQESGNKGDSAQRGIAGGDPVSREQSKAYGAILGLQMGNALCTGTHIGGKYILTAHHCIGRRIEANGGENIPFIVVSPDGPTMFRVAPDAYRVSYPAVESTEQLKSGKARQPDLALIDILTPPKEFLAIPNAVLANVSADAVDGKFMIAGYGISSFNPNGTSGQLYTGRTAIQKSDTLFHHLIWSESRGGGAAMPGDSGGPLFVFSQGKVVVFGVLSTGAQISKDLKPVDPEQKGNDTAALWNRYVRIDRREMRDFILEATR